MFGSLKNGCRVLVCSEHIETLKSLAMSQHANSPWSRKDTLLHTHLTSVGKSSDPKKYAIAKAAEMKHLPQTANPTLARRAISG